MSQKSSELIFINSLHSWSLSFYDPVEEEKYQAQSFLNANLPQCFKISGIVLTLLMWAYKLLDLYMAFNPSNGYPTGTPRQELFLFSFASAALLLDGLLRMFGVLKKFQGFLVYTAVPVIGFSSDVFSNGTHCISIRYIHMIIYRTTFILIMSASTSVVYTNYWLTAAAGNCASGIINILIYYFMTDPGDLCKWRCVNIAS